MKMRKNSVFFLVLLAVWAVFMVQIPQARAAGPYLIVGTVNNADNSVPADNDVTFSAYISTRPTEILTQTSNGCGYSGGLYSVEVGNFPTAWNVNDVLVVNLLNLTSLQGKSIQVTLKGDFSENATNAVLAALTPLTLTIAPVAPTVQVPNTQQFTATATFTGVTGDQNVTAKAAWQSSDTDKGTINTAGLFTPNHVGTTDITATLADMTSNTSTVTVTAGPLATLTVSPNNPTLTADQTQQFTVTGMDAKGNTVNTGTITWTGGAGIGTIDAGTGLFNATTVGTGTVTATSSIGGIADSSGTITVNAGALATLTISPNTAALTAGQTQQFTAAGFDADGNATSAGTITWSGGAGIGSINPTSGLFSATTAAAGTVTATSSLGKSVTSGAITVTPGDAHSVIVTADPSIISSTIQSLSNLIATIYDAFSNIVTTFVNAVTFTVDSVVNGDIVDKNPVTPASGTGVAENQLRSIVTTTGGTITVTADAGNGVTGTTTVTTAPFSITAPTFPWDVRVGETVNFAAQGPGSFSWTFSAGSPATAATQNVTWTAPPTTTGNAPLTVNVAVTDPAHTNLQASNSVTVYVLPDPVITQQIGTTREKRPTLTWNASTNAVQYDIQISKDANFVSWEVADPVGNVTSYTPTADLPEGKHYWRVKASDGTHFSNFSPAASFTVDTTPPGPVTSFGAPNPNSGITKLASGNLKLVWIKPTDADFAGVIVVGATNAAPTLEPVDGTPYAVGKAGTDDILYVGDLETYQETLAHGILRYYKVFAYDAVKNYSPAAEAHETSSDTTPPAAPTNPTISAGNAQVTLGWTNPTDDDFAGIVILQKAGSPPAGTPTAGSKYTVGTQVGDATVAYAEYANKAATATITGLTNSTRYYFAIYAVDERPNYSTTAASVNAIPGPPIISASATLPASVRVGGTVVFTATSGMGSYAWTATGGSLSATTGDTTTWTAPANVTTVPAPFTVRVTNPDTGLYAEGVVNVYPKVEIDKKPATPPTVLPGTDSATFSVKGGEGTNYIWTVKNSAGVTVHTSPGASSYTFNAPNTGLFAGVYTISVTDSTGIDNLDTIDVKVPYTVTLPNSDGSGTVTKWNFKTNETRTFTVAGADSSKVYTWDILATQDATDPAASGDYGTWGTETPVDPQTKTRNFTATATTLKSFWVRVTVADPKLATAGLDKITIGPFYIIPASTYKVTVSDANGFVTGADVSVEFPKGTITKKITDSSGEASFTLPDLATGGSYTYTVAKANFITQKVTSGDKAIPVTLVSAVKTITGSVTSAADGSNLADATITAYLTATPAVQYFAVSAADGSYTVYLPGDAANTGWSVKASKAAFKSDTKVAGAIVNNTVAVPSFSLPAGADTKLGVAGGEVVSTDTYKLAGLSAPAGAFPDDTVIAIAEKSPPATAGGSPKIIVITAAGGAQPSGRIQVTIPVNKDVVKPGDFENRRYVIFHATDAAALAAGNVSEVKVEDIVMYPDYSSNDSNIGYVTFLVDHLSAFGVGVPIPPAPAPAPAPASGGSTSTSGCFIATAAYGSYMEDHVMALRHFRDAYLLTNDWGRAFVSFYYRTSPPIADFIAKHDGIRAVVRMGLAPVVGVAYLTVNTTPVQKALLLFALMGLLAGGVVLLLRTRRYRQTIG